MAAADAYPSTASGITARYHAAGVLATLYVPQVESILARVFFLDAG